MHTIFKSLILVFIITSFQLYAEDNKNDNATKLIEQFVKETGTPGLSISVGLAGKIIWSKGFGYADVEQNVAVDPAFTKFRVGSVAKPMTAFALAQLVDRKKINLDAEVQNYVPSFPKKKYPITIRQIAGHLSGIRHYKGNEFFKRTQYDSVLEGLTIFQDEPLVHEPGLKYSYTSYGYNLLSAAVEQAAEKPFLELMSENVFLPLGMNQTAPDNLESILKYRGRYYLRRDNQLFNEPEVNNSHKWASGGFLSTSDDLVRFGFAHLDNKYLTQDTIDLLWKSQKTKAGKITGYGIGWNTKTDKNGNTWYGHGGGSVGGSTQFWLLPKQGLVIAMISNLSSFDYGDVMIKLSEIFIDVR